MHCTNLLPHVQVFQIESQGSCFNAEECFYGGEHHARWKQRFWVPGFGFWVLVEWALGAVCAMVCFVPSPPAISFTHHSHTDRSQTALLLHQVLTLHQQWTWLGLCVPWFVPSPPAISFTHPNHSDRSQTGIHLHQVLTLHQQWTWLGWLCPHLFLTPCSLTLPHSLHIALACWL